MLNKGRINTRKTFPAREGLCKSIGARKQDGCRRSIPLRDDPEFVAAWRVSRAGLMQPARAGSNAATLSG